MKGRSGVAPHFLSFLSPGRLRFFAFFLSHAHFVCSIAFVVAIICAIYNNKIHHFEIVERWHHDEESALTIKYEGFARRKDGLKAQSEYSPG